MPESSVLDRGALDELRAMTGDDTALYVELLDTFLTDADTYLDELSAADDAGAVTRPAHSLKSNALTVGATTLAELCRALEADSRAGGDILPPTAIPQRASAVADELAKVRPAVVAERDRVLGGS
jgi:HPt (histidine-containing phosphotransfer) domain-containing protein